MKKNEIFSVASTPESVGIPSRAVLAFLNRIDKLQINLHGFLLLRQDQIASEGYWAPYAQDELHRMYSVSKSYVALAIGLLVDDGKIALTDRVIEFFRDLAPAEVHPWLEAVTVRDLLMMAAPYSELSYGRYDKDWAWCFFNSKHPSHPAGTIFWYDTAATVVLTTIVERLSGQPFLEFMRPRVLDPIGVSPDVWCIKTPEGTSWGGSGVMFSLRDMARVALLCLNKGQWDGQQLISEAYVTAATGKQIDNSMGGNAGYGYQIWREEDNGFSFRGMGSQLAYCFPDKDFIFTCISDTQGSGSTGEDIYEAMREEIYAHLADGPLPEDPAGFAALQEKIKDLQILPQRGQLTAPAAERVNGQWYELEENPMGISRVQFNFQEDKVLWRYTNAQGDNELVLGLGKQAAGQFPQKNYFGEQIGTSPGLTYKCLASAAWVEPDKLDMLVYITDDYLGTLKASVSFKDQQISIYMVKVAEWFLDEYDGFAGGKMIDG